MSDLPPRTHNSPPESVEDIYAEIDPTKLLVIPVDDLWKFLEIKYAHLVVRRDTYVGATKRWITAHTHDDVGIPKIALDGSDGPDTLDTKRQWEDFIDKEVPDAKKAAKKDLLAACAVMERFFMDALAEPVQSQRNIVHDAHTRYLRQLAQKRKEDADKEAAAALETAIRLRRLAEQVPEGDTQRALTEKATEALVTAQEAAATAAGPLSALSRERGFVAQRSAGLREYWSWRLKPEGKLALIQAVARGEASADLLNVDDSRLKKLATASKGKVAPPPGIEFYKEERS